jgi:hypothetical protein
MENKEFKKLFNEVAKKNDFESAFGGWFKESRECIAALYLQKSNYGNYYELNIKIFIQGVFGNQYQKSKELKYATSAILGRQPEEYRDVFDLDSLMENVLRKEKLEKLFNDFIVPLVNSMLTREGIKKHALNDKDFLTPALNKELGL